MKGDAAFHEVLHLRRGPGGWALFLMGATLCLAGPLLFSTVWPVAFIAPGVAMILVTWFAGTETTVTDSEIVLRMRPYPWPRRIALADVRGAEIVIADSSTTYFGGWEGSRGGHMGAVVESIEGPKQVGNRSIRLTLSSGKPIQFATWQPRRALQAITAPDKS